MSAGSSRHHEGSCGWWVVSLRLRWHIGLKHSHTPHPHTPDLSVLGAAFRLKDSLLSSISWYSLISEKRSGRLTWALPSTFTNAFSPEGEAPILLPYQFQMEEIESFRYRCRVSLTKVGRRDIVEWAVTQGLCPIAEHAGLRPSHPWPTHRMPCAQ